MRTTAILFATTIFALGGMSPARSAEDVIHETSTLGLTGEMGGWALFSNQYLGARFFVEDTTEVTSIGGHVFGDGRMFGVVVQLDGPHALPIGEPFDDAEVVQAITFVPPRPSADFLVPFSATLEPGHYGLIFGYGQFGADADDGAMPVEGQKDLLSASYFGWIDQGRWIDGNVFGLRFVMTGLPVADVLPLELEITRGVRLAGDLESLFESDDDHLIIQARRPPAVSQPSAQVVLDGDAGIDGLRRIRFTVEAAATFTDVEQWIDFFNFQDDRWERMSTRNATTDDSVVVVEVTADADRFVSGEGGIRARVSFYDPGIPVAAWWGRIDQAIWRVTPAQ